jgi:hypothetical protein
MTSASDFPEFILAVPFNEFDHAAYTLNYYINPYNGQVAQQATLTPSSNPPTYSFSQQFYRLNMLQTGNMTWSSRDMDPAKVTGITCNGGGMAYCFNDSKAFACQSGSVLDVTLFTCAANCPTGYMIGRGGSRYCSRDLSAQTAIYTITSNTVFTCVAGYTKYFDMCIQDVETAAAGLYNYSSPRGGLYLSYLYNFPAIEMTLSSINAAWDFQSYYLEFWWMMETNSLITFTGTKNYFFYANSIRLYHNDAFTTFTMEDCNGNNLGNFTTSLNLNNWNKFSYKVIVNGAAYDIALAVNNNFSTPALTATGISNCALNKITFCHNDSACSVNINWSAGYYRNLRVWDATTYSVNINDAVVWQYGAVFDSTYSNRIISTPIAPWYNRSKYIALNFPFSLTGINNNTFTDTVGSYTFNANTAYAAYNTVGYPLYNTNSYFDNLMKTAATGKYLNSSYTATTCNGKCTSCYDNLATTCTTCTAASAYLSYNSCKAYPDAFVNYYAYASPNIANADLVLTNATASKKFTISFYVKLLGFQTITSGVSNVFIYGTTLRIQYDHTLDQLQFVIFNVNPNLTLATVNTFSTYFGRYCHIGVAYQYDSAKSAYHPPFIHISVDNVSLTISNNTSANLSPLSFATLTIPNTVFGLFARLRLYDKFLIGVYGYDTNIVYWTTSPTVVPSKKFIDNTSSTCIAAADLASAITSTNIVCHNDQDSYFDENAYVNGNYVAAGPTAALLYSVNASNVASTANCSTSSPKCYETCYTTSACSCRSDSTAYWLFQNTNNPICQELDYLDFARFATTSINVKSSSVGYTLEFWYWIYNYIPNGVQSYEVQWDKQARITIGVSGGNLKVTCYPVYDSGTAYATNLSTNASNYTWQYVRCSTDRVAKAYKIVTDSNLSGTTGTYATHPASVPNPTTLVFTDASAYDSWGVLYFRQIRLWTCYDCMMSSLYKAEIKTTYLDYAPDLIHVFDPYFNTSYKIIDLTTNATTVTATTRSPFFGYNPIDESKYSLKVLCLETQNCLELAPLSNYNNYTFDKVPASQYGRYTIEFWVSIKDVADFANGFNVIYSKHIAVNMIQDTNLTDLRITCFPQDYLISPLGKQGNNFFTFSQTIYNKDSVNVTNPNTVWTWVRCATSWDMQQFYLNSNAAKTLRGETLYTNSYNDYTFKYFWFDKDNTTVVVDGAQGNATDVYIRTIYVFNDYLPNNYIFKNALLTKITPTQFTSLVFAVDYTNMVYTSGGNTYWTTLSTTGKASPGLAAGKTATIDSTYVVVTLCDPASASPKVYKTVAGVTNCFTMTCVGGNANLCIIDNKPLTCKPNFFLNITGAAPGTTTCDTLCPASTLRSPCSPIDSAICNLSCNTNYNGCSGTTFTNAQLLDLPGTLKCANNFDRVSYQCYDDTTNTQSAMYFNSCYNFNSVYNTFSSTEQTATANGYILEFWLKPDKVNFFCTQASTSLYYFYSVPHTFYMTNPGGTTLTYQNTVDTSFSGDLTNFNMYEWNYILIQVTDTKINIYTNQKSTADLTFSISTSSDHNITGLGFCRGNCNAGGVIATNIIWGSAYYRNIRIYDNSLITVDVIKEYILGKFNTPLKAVLSYYPLTGQSGDLNVIKNSITGGTNIDFTKVYTTGAQANTDQCQLYNFSNDDFDWGISNQKKFITSATSAGLITYSSCDTNCSRCYSNKADDCYQCKVGYVLMQSKCVKANGFFLGIPTGSSSIINIKLNDGGSIDITKQPATTLSFWIKFYGIINSATSLCPVIMRFSQVTDSFLCIDNTSTLFFYHLTSDVVYKQDGFDKYMGQWVFFSISNYYSDNFVYFPNMMLLYLQAEQVTREVTYEVPGPGLNIDNIDIGNEIAALITDLRFYNNYVIRPYGRVMSLYFSNTQDLVLQRKLLGTSTTNCLQNSDVVSGDISGLKHSCVADYHPYLDTANRCVSNDNFFNITNSANYCLGKCDSTCTNNNLVCATKTNLGCSCAFNDFQWLRRDNTTDSVYCDNPPYLDFAKTNTTKLDNVKVASDGEYSLEFWFYLYSYNQTISGFSSYELIWDKMLKATLYDKNSKLTMRCNPIYDTSSPSSSTDYDEDTTTLKYYQWNYVQCSTSLNDKKFYVNANSAKNIQQTIPKALGNGTMTNFVMQPAGHTNYGFLFFREIKLWAIYNIREFFTKCTVGQPKYLENLLHYLPLTTNSTTIIDGVEGISTSVVSSTEWFGYNLVDYDNVFSIEKIPFTLKNCPYLTVAPTSGYFAITNFLVKCVPPDDKTYTFRYYYTVSGSGASNATQHTIQNNTDQSEITFPFTDTSLSDSETDINVFCEILVNGTALTAFGRIQVYLNSGMKDISFPNVTETFDLTNEYSEQELLNRARTLSSLAYNFYEKTAVQNMTQVKPTVDETVIVVQDPTCNANYCNKQGDCYLIDKFIACSCKAGYLGINCQVSEQNLEYLKTSYYLLWNQLTYGNNFTTLGVNVTSTRVEAINWIISGASRFFPDDYFFTQYYNFLSYLTTYTPQVIVDNYELLFDTFDHIISYNIDKVNKFRIQTMNSTSDREADVSITQRQNIINAFTYVRTTIEGLANQFIYALTNTAETEVMNLNFFSYHINVKKIDSPLKFDFNGYFQTNRANYDGFFDASQCMSTVQYSKAIANSITAGIGGSTTTTASKPTASGVYSVSIYYKINPYVYDDTYHTRASFLHSIYFTDGNGNVLDVKDCEGPIQIYSPVYTYNSTIISYLNANKTLFDPNTQYGPTDPIFTNPYYIDVNGTVSNQTQQERIDKYHRFYNFTCQFYDVTKSGYSPVGMQYANFTHDNFIVCNTTHLTDFQPQYVYNPPDYPTDGPFYYIGSPRIFLCSCNYFTNLCFFLILFVLVMFFLSLILSLIFDIPHFRKEVLIDHIKLEILKDQKPYLSEGQYENALKKFTKIIPGDVPMVNLDNNGYEASGKADVLKLRDNQFDNLDSIHASSSNKMDNGGGDPVIVNNYALRDMSGRQASYKEDFYENEYELTPFQLFKYNLKHRHVYFSAYYARSSFNPRYKKITLLFTQLSIMLMFNAIFFTIDTGVNIVNIY